MKSKNEQLEVIESRYQNQSITLSNTMIHAREVTNLLESKIEILAIHHMDIDMRQKEKTDANGETYSINYVMLPATEIKQLMGRTDGDVYTDIRNASIAMKSKFMIFEDRQERRFVLKNLYNDIIYDNGRLCVEFEPSMEKFFIGLKENFTRLKLPILFSFERNGGLQLYKLLRSEAYKLPDIDPSLSQVELPSFDIHYNLVDLRMMLGYVDISQDALKKEGSKKRPDWEKMVDAERHQKYKRWSDFYTRVIKPGIDEINTKSDIYISDMKKEMEGRGGKISGLVFTIQYNHEYFDKHSEGNMKRHTPVTLSEADIDDFLDEMREIIKEPVKTKDLKQIAKVAGYDLEKIKEAYAAADAYPKDITNLTAFLIKAIREGFSAPVGKAAQVKDSNWFNRYTQKEYDFDQLENFIANH